MDNKTHRDYANEFSSALEKVLANGISISSVAKKMNVNRQKLYDIKSGRSSGDILMLQRINEAYPQFLEDKSESSTDYQSEDDEKDKEIERLKKLIIEQRSRIDKMIDLLYDKEKGTEE